MQSLNKLVEQLDSIPIVFVGGKGGVGKTTTAAALASQFAANGQKTLIISTDPAHSLGDVFDVKLSNQTTTLTDKLDALELNPDIIIDEHFARVERTISSYANPDMLPKIKQHLQLSKSAPGAQEAAMLEAICRHLVDAVEQNHYDHIIFDTAPTGHTLRLLTLPEMMAAWTDGLLSQQRRQAKLKSAADHVAGHSHKHNDNHQHHDNELHQPKRGFNNPFADAKPVDRWQQAVEVLNKRKALFRQAGELLHDKHKTALILVLTADNLPIEETRRAVEQLKQAQLAPAALVVNQLIQLEQQDSFWQQRAARQQKLVADIEHYFNHYPLYALYLQQSDVRGLSQLQQLS
ncbi:ArsA family ATPase [Psychrobacter sp. FDAARGOS_221]|uniref:ArsA family ATPase n=1 Tax=Psychrobacter sp. FDAARGOS_221 TaxID=1975705 RepID=UPI000BB570CA|nr:ArsA family ATPase [Psychrobacter sp. FDAARGOS_221]PNK59646.1 arsenic-transporting ATPase [Psychrobacter sp. FDAARGOS_221]